MTLTSFPVEIFLPPIRQSLLSNRVCERNEQQGLLYTPVMLLWEFLKVNQKGFLSIKLSNSQLNSTFTVGVDFVICERFLKNAFFEI